MNYLNSNPAEDNETQGGGLKRVAVSPELPADENASQSVEQTSINQLGAQIHRHASQHQRQPRLVTDGWELQQPWSRSFQPEFQDSNQSPALSLLPVNSGVEHNFTEYSLFQQSDNEFAPLRAYPDISMASERLHFPPQDRTTQASERGSLSQHPLAQTTTLSQEGVSSCCSLSQHSLSLIDEGRREETVHSPPISTTDRRGVPSRDDTSSREKDAVTPTDPPDKLVVEGTEDETFFLSKNIPALHLLELLQKDIGMPSSSSSAVSSASETSVKAAASFAEESKSTKVCKPHIDQSMVRREGPPGEASLPQQQTQQPDRDLYPDQSRTLSSEVSNITMGLRSTKPDESSEVLRRELLSEVERHSSCEAESKNQQRKSPRPPGPSLIPYPTGTSEGKPSVTRTNLGGLQWTGKFSAGIERGHREQDLWSSGNQTGIDGSYLGFLPQSQSTPGVFKAPPKSSVKAKLQLSAIESNKENSYESNTGISAQPAVPEADVHRPDTATQSQEEATSAKVQSLPSLNYMQKVDAWRANQSSGKTSLFDSLALQGFSGTSPKKKAYDAVSDPLNCILSQQVRSLQQPPVSSAANQKATQSSSTAPSGSSSRRGEAVGSAPSDNDNTGSATRPSASPFGRSQSHSSLSTIVTSVQKDQQKNRPAEEENSRLQGDVHHQTSATVQPSARMSLGQFSDVSLDRDFTLSSSQGSYNSGIKVGTSIGASSVVSLEVDNYAPYWTSKLSTPPPMPRPRDLNIEERIPLYLRNLGIDQSPSTILTPFEPRGPIREPEFSPTDLCTIKGSDGTPTKSTQPSEGGSPHKRDFSRCSVLSVESSVSIPLSLDSLGPGVSIPERPRRASPSSDREALHNERRLAPSSLPDEGSYPSTQQQHMDSSLTSSQNTIELRDRFDSDLSLSTRSRCAEREFELQTSGSLEQNAEDSIVSSNAMLEIHNLLSQAENVLSAGSSEASSTSPAASRLLSDDDIFLSLRKKTSRLKDSSFSSSYATEDPRIRSSLRWARSSSDSMLASEKLRENSIGRESVTSSGQPNYPSTQALITATGAYRRPQDSTVGKGAESSLVLSQSARRAEPEGCSAAPPDNTVPPQPPVSNPSPVLNTQPLTSTPTDTAGVTEEETQTALEGSLQSSPSSPILLEDTDQGGMSDGSSESSLAVRVAKLLQSESPSTMVSSTPSTTDQEESKAREWIKLTISGQQCEPLELDKEDRKRIEEIKRELLLKNPIKSQGSTDTESSAVSSIRVQREQDPPQQAKTFNPLGVANNQPSQPLQGLHTDLSDSSLQLQNPPRPDLEAQIREIAAREGVTLPRTNLQALTSITIATRKRSTSPSPSTPPASPLSPAPELLHLAELSTGAVQLPNRQLPPMEQEDEAVFEPSSSLDTRNKNLTSPSPGNQKRQNAVGGQFEEPPPPLQGLGRNDVNATEDNVEFFRRDDELSVQDGSVSGVSHKAEQATGSSTSESPARTGHVSHVHLTLSPKATDHSLSTAALSSHSDAVTGLPRKEFVPLRPSSSAASSPAEGVGLSSPPKWHDAREPKRQRVPERPETSTLFKTAVPQRRKTSTSAQSFTPRHRVVVSPRPFTTTETPVPVLLPYKPRGSEELFYVPQTEADVSNTDSSDTTMESSHTGSDDAVPPRFSSEVLGHRDAGLDCGVTIKHSEGIYSKRLKTTTIKMQEPGRRDVSVSTDGPSQTRVTKAPKPSSQVSVAFTRVPLSSNQGASKRDQGTSPVHFPSYEQPEPSRVRFQPDRVDMDYDKASRHLDQSSVPQAGGEGDQERRDSHLPRPNAQQSSSTLEQLWERFCDRRSLEESRPTNDKEASLLERLERLSRLIHNTRSTNMSELREEKLGRRGEDATGKDIGEVKRSVGFEARKMERKAGGDREVEGEPPAPRQAWTQRLQVEETSQPADEDSFTSSFSQGSSQIQHLYPADRDESENLSTASGSMSTVDTARLIRAFGAHRVQHLKTSSCLGKLYNTIDKQKEGREQRRGRNKEPPHIITLSETTGTDESTVAADSTSTSSYTVPSHRGPSRTLAAKKAVKMVSRGIQAGDLELVSSGTRSHTRDVGTTFPSPGEARTSRQISSSSSSLERRRGGRPSKSQGLQKQRKSKRSPPKTYPEGVSWFISADDLRSEARKENRPEEEESTWRPSTAWFEPYSKMNPWREPLRQRQVHEDRNKHHAEPDLNPRTKTISSGLARISLQEALEMRRPEFISKSMRRVERLALQVEERKLQEDFSRERDELFSRPGGPRRLLRPAGTALLRRAVPRKEMIQRSKQIYENLPEVQRRKEEERRKAEYRSYRLNAHLYNKRITNRVLGRRTVWQ
ncbi:platelet binding protein GspB isoform X1 [Sebastes umbrosus]|uniref:platelet binding protein GspB isoform X1 n=1 Tax=Sebastes umbrosus TaxID=72105 RepID=UPI0018A01ECD|nr:platelet binding protein GspB isoform X1 [Sebastes umbrosus]